MAHVKAAVGRLAAERHDVDGGWLVRTPDLPLVWTLNGLHVTVPGDADLVTSMAEHHQGAMAYRHVVVDDDATGAAVASALGGSWTVAREVFMVLDAAPAGGRVAVEELGEDDMVALMRRWLAEDHPDMSEAGYAQMEQYHRRDGRLWHERRLGARDGRGAP